MTRPTRFQPIDDETATAHSALEQALCTAFEEWRRREGVAQEGDVLELLMVADLTPAQRDWLTAFVALWEASGL